MSTHRSARSTHMPGMRRRAGFTLVELMVSMSIGLAVLGAGYYITRTSSRMFAEQLRRAETQLTLRGAVELLRRDISRAGFAGVRSTGEMPGCTNSGVANGWIGRVGNTSVDVSPVALAAAWIETPAAGGLPRLYLSGNFSTSEQYVVDGDRSTPLVLELQTSQHSFLRSFMAPFPAPVDSSSFLTNRFVDAFLATRDRSPPGRMLNVVNLVTRKSFLRLVDAVGATLANPTVTLKPETPLPSGQPGEAGCDWGPRSAVVAPISTIVYEVVSTADAAQPEVAAAVSATNDDIHMSGGQRWVLVRREVDMASLGLAVPPPPGARPTVIPSTTRAIVDFVEPQAGFSIQAIYDRAPQNVSSAPDLQRMAVNTNPAQLESLRSLVIEIVARSAENENVGAQQERQRAFAGRRTARFEVFMPNMSRNPGVRP